MFQDLFYTVLSLTILACFRISEPADHSEIVKMADELHYKHAFLEMFFKDNDDSDDSDDDIITEGGIVIQEDTPQGLALEHPVPERTPFEIGKYVVLVCFAYFTIKLSS